MEYEVKAGTKLLRILETIQGLEQPTLSNIASEVDMPNSTTYNHLETLKQNGYLREDDGEHRLTLKFLDYGVHAKQQLDIASTAPPILKQLSEETNEAAWIMVEERGYVIGLEKALSERAVQTSGRIGRHTRFHYHAPGKALLAHLPEERIEPIIDQQGGLPARTENTITDRDELVAELEEIRDRGVAFGDGEAIAGVRSVAAPVICDGTVEGSVAVVGPKNRLQGDRFREEIPALVSGAANEIELRMVYGNQ
jgi:DNA-binding IclR family transcriptional regulator